jgi:hypothetical protein
MATLPDLHVDHVHGDSFRGYVPAIGDDGTANVEANFTNCARKTLTDADVAAMVPDDTSDRMDIDIPDQIRASAGGAVNNSLVKVLVCCDADTTGGADIANAGQASETNAALAATVAKAVTLGPAAEADAALAIAGGADVPFVPSFAAAGRSG